jgi:hypothetical protein
VRAVLESLLQAPEDVELGIYGSMRAFYISGREDDTGSNYWPCFADSARRAYYLTVESSNIFDKEAVASNINRVDKSVTPPTQIVLTTPTHTLIKNDCAARHSYDPSHV